LASIVIKNWDNKTWLSSNDYIKSFSQFLLRNTDLNSNSKILDIGCGRGKIIGDLSSRLYLKIKPIGIDLIKHEDKDKRIRFKKIDALSFFVNNRKKFDLILIKQTIHLLSLHNIKKLINNCKKNLNSDGVILVFTLDPYNNEIPSFRLMKKKLNKSLHRDKMISKLLFKLNSRKVLKRFFFKVKITKKKYIKMIQNRFISTLLHMNKKEILKGIKEIDEIFNKILRFNDNLICIILKK
jgi:cyclopropane fatty-acyl-phospholipid synthase-like methyltransferase